MSKDLNPVVNIGTGDDPTLAMCATTMMMMFEKSTGKKYDPDIVDEYMSYCDGYRDAYNANLSNGIKLTTFHTG